MLEEENNKTNKFLTRYFDWGPDAIPGGHFCHIPVRSIAPSSNQSSIVSLILEKKYLNVFKLKKARNVCDIYVVVVVRVLFSMKVSFGIGF